MSNVFLNNTCKDIETALLLEKAKVLDIGNAVAYTDGDRVYINTDDNLYKILPDYNQGMLKWLLWHEAMHNELKHHNRFYRYLNELSHKSIEDEFQLTKNEVNIIMDILVHDSLSKMFPELIETAKNNLSQMRDRNSLSYTFKTKTLEKMLDEYKAHKKGDDTKDKESEGEGEDKKEDTTDEDEEKEGKTTIDKSTKGHGEGEEEDEKDTEPTEEGTPDIKDETIEEPETAKGEHDMTDWSKLDSIDTDEFITRSDADEYDEQIERLKRKKFRLAKLTKTLNGLATSTRERSFAVPSTIQVGKSVILKGRKPGRTALYLCFDASGSMGNELETFKNIISKSIPQAMDVPCEWFTDEYGKGKFRDIMKVHAYSGFCDDGDRVIKLCYEAERLGYSPIGVTDGGGGLSWGKKYLTQLKRTVLVGQNKDWLENMQAINSKIQILDI